VPRPKIQLPNGAIQIGSWAGHEDFAVFPVGSKPKRMLVCPSDAAEPHLIPGHSYLFKTALGWQEQQVWSEIIAYQVAALVDLDVPPCFPAVEQTTGQTGVLVEFFYGFPDDAEAARFVPAADFLSREGKNNERPHSVRTNILCSQVLEIKDAIDWWAKVVAFDSLIGNTDRHLENWGFLVRRQRGVAPAFVLAPAFDNGTSLGYEQPPSRLGAAADQKWLKSYIDRGRHHCGWLDGPTPHFSLCEEFLKHLPNAGPAMKSVIRFEKAQIDGIVERCSQFGLSIPFTAERARFVSSLIEARRQRLAKILGV